MKKDFNTRLKEGRRLEKGVKVILEQLLPECTVKNTDQDWGSKEREEYHLCDVVVLNKDGKPVLGIECKYNNEIYPSCKILNGWDYEHNTPLNASSVREYIQAEFPLYVMNFNEKINKVLVADIYTIMLSKRDCGKRKKSGDTFYNYDSRNWMVYEAKDGITKEILQDILKKEKLC